MVGPSWTNLGMAQGSLEYSFSFMKLLSKLMISIGREVKVQKKKSKIFKMKNLRGKISVRQG